MREREVLSAGYAAYITVNDHTRFKQQASWAASGAVKQLVGLRIGSGTEKYPLSAFRIESESLDEWKRICSAATVLNMILTKKPEVIEPSVVHSG